MSTVHWLLAILWVGLFAFTIAAVHKDGIKQGSTVSIAPEDPPPHAIQILPYTTDDGSIFLSIQSARWEIKIDGKEAFHGDTTWWTGDELPTIRLVKYHPPPGTELPQVTGDVPQ